MSSKIVISKILQTNKSIVKLFEPVVEKIQNISSAVIQIDLSYPQSHPITTDPEILDSVIQLLLSQGVEQISVVGESIYSIPSPKIWNALGFSEYITSKYPQVHLISMDDPQTEKSIHEITYGHISFPKIVEDTDLFISIINPKVSFLNKLNLSMENAQNLLTNMDREISEEKEENFCENDLYKKKHTQNLIDTYFLRPPDLVLYDFTSILSKAGPTMYGDSRIIHSDLYMLTENGVIGDLVALSLLGIESDEDPTIQAIKDYDYALVSEDTVKKYSVSLILDKEGEFIEENISSLINGPKTGQKQRFWKKKEENLEESAPLIHKLELFIETLDIFPHKVEICKGLACSGCKKAANELLLFLKTAMGKDKETVPSFSLLFGNNPVEPSNEYCIVFGDCAVESTKTRKFRKKILTKRSRSDTDMELEQAKLKIKLQKKLVELESHSEFIKQEIPEGKRRDRAIKRLERRLSQAKRMSELRIKLNDWHLKQMQSRNKKLREFSKEVPNKFIIEIHGCPPNYLVNLEGFIKLFGKRWSPGLTYNYNFLEEFLVKNSYEKEGVE